MFTSSYHVSDGHSQLKEWQLTKPHLEKNVNRGADVWSVDLTRQCCSWDVYDSIIYSMCDSSMVTKNENRRRTSQASRIRPYWTTTKLSAQKSSFLKHFLCFCVSLNLFSSTFSQFRSGPCDDFRLWLIMKASTIFLGEWQKPLYSMSSYFCFQSSDELINWQIHAM